MESIEHLLADLAALDIKLWVEEGTLHFDAPAGSFGDDLRGRVLAAKPALISLLQKKACATACPPQEPASLINRREPPATASECRLAGLWGEFLKTGEIGRDDDFFILGGHSLLLMRLVHRIEAEGLGKIDLGQAMAARTLAKMAALLDARSSRKNENGQAEAIPPCARAAANAPPLLQPRRTGDAGASPPAQDLCTSDSGADPDRQFIADLNQTARPYPRDASLAGLWQAAATGHAELTALVHGHEKYTYRHLDVWAGAIAAGLFAAGVRPGSTVALALRRAPEAVAALIAVLKCGAAYLPLDEKVPPRLVARLLATTGARWVIADQAGRERLSSLADIRMLPLEQLATSPAGTGIISPPVVGGGDPAYVMFTSGSTGEPKGVIVPHRAVARLALDPGVLALKPGDGMAQTAPFGFDAATLEIWATLLSGARLVFIEDGDLMEPTRLEHCLHEGGVNVVWLTASLFNRVADLHPQAFRSLDVLLTGGEVLSVPHLKKVRAACPNLRILNCYGPTENTTFTTLHTLTDADLAGDSVPIGRPIANTRVYLLDEALSPVGNGVWGELCAAGDGLAIGYAGRPDLTDQAFVTLRGPFQERIYRTGDLARWRSDGVLEFGGRRDGQIKLRGHRIETSAIEAVLSDFPGVQDSLVMAVGEGETKELVAFVAGRSRDEMAWRRHLAERLPIYMMPARFLVLDTLPVNANGKKDRTALAAMLTDHRGDDGKGTRFPAALPSGKETEDFPLSSGQERLWILQRLAPESASYNVPLALDIQGVLDSSALTRALLALEERHHALRLCVRPPGGQSREARQHLLAPGNLAPLTFDFRNVADPDATVEEKVQAESTRPFLLEEEAPARAFLFRLQEERWRLLLVIHHIACDGWSVGILLHDLAALYARESGASAPPLPPIEYQLADDIVWQGAFLESEAGRSVLERRTRRLSPVPAPLDLPTDHRRPAVRNFAGETLYFPFDPAISRCIDQLARDAGVTPFVLLLGLVEVLLYRLCGRGGSGDFALGSLSAGRDRPELSGLVGFLVNTLVIPCHIQSDQTFREHLAKVQEEWMAALSDQQCPFAHLVESLNLPRDLARNPLFDVLVVWQDAPPELPESPLFKVAPVQPDLPFAKFDLTFHFLKKGRESELSLEYSRELFEPPTATRIAQRLQALISAVVNTPDAPLSRLDIWLPGEKTTVIEEFNDTRTALPTRRAISEPFLECLRSNPTAPAVLSAQGEALDYTRFARRAGAVAAHLAAAGVRPGEAVALILHRSPEMMAAIHGILMAGAVYVPLDPDQPPARLRELLGDLGQPPVLADESLHRQLAGCCRPLSLPPAAAEAEPCSLAAPEDLAYIIFTSGSTGRPKGVLIEHHAVLNRILWMQRIFPIGRGDVILQKTPTTFDVSVWELFWWSWTGAAVAMLGPGQERDPEALAAAIEKHRVTTIHFVPSMLATFLDGLESGRLDRRRISSLRRVFVSGEALDAALAERFNRLVFTPLGAELHNLYGPTEATVDVSWHPASPWQGGDAVSIGRPIANTRLYILDAEQQAMPVGIPGEIAIGGVQVARGYLNQPELSAERFITDPVDPEGRIYLTGDIGRWRNDGCIEYLGRADCQVKIRGQRIEPGEIEHALERHPLIDRAVVIPALNQGLVELHAWLLCKVQPEIAAVRRFLRQHLPESMIPARFFPLDELPQTTSGKLDRQALAGRSQKILGHPPEPVTPKPAPFGHENVALTTRFKFDEAGETLTISLCYNPRLLTPDEAATLAGRYSSLLQEMANPSDDINAPGLPCSLPQQERR